MVIVEVWKTCIYNGVTYDGYEVSTEGKVRSLNYRGHGKVQELKQRKNDRGYLSVILCKNGKTKHCRVNRLVAEVFIPNPNNKPTVNHINEQKDDNRVENLEWATHKEQVHHGTYMQRRAKTQGKRVLCIETGVIYESTSDASRKTGLSQSNISECCRGIRKTTGGYTWKYIT